MKKKTIIILPLVLCLVVFLGVYYVLNHEDKSTSLTILEKRWIENNSATKVNLDIINDLAVFGENGTGVLFDFANDFELETDLEFNKIPYSKLTNPTSNELQFRILNNDARLTENDLLLYEDGYILVGSTNIRYDSIKNIKDQTIGVLNTDAADATYYLKTATNITYKTYENITAMTEALNKSEVNIILIPQVTYLGETINAQNLYINYYFSELSKKIVLTLTKDNEKLNSIISKYFTNWKKQRYVETYNRQYLNYYVSKKNMPDKTKQAMLSKTYVYGYVENAPFEVSMDKKIYGIAGEYVQRIKRLTGIDITYKKYRTYSDLKTAIKNKEIDFYFDTTGITSSGYQMTTSPFVEEFVVLSNANIGKSITTFESLKGEEINILEGNLLYNYIKDNTKATIIPKQSIDNLKDNNKLIVIDKEYYEYYKTTKFKNYDVTFTGSANIDYKFGIKNDNKDFYNLFNYIIGTNTYYNYRMVGLDSLNVSLIERTTFAELYLIILGLVLLPILIFTLLYLFLKKKKEVKVVKKEDRRKYTDMLTSLKNRNYLNFNMNNWEESKIYPQSFIVVDLNNVSYINDNYGHEEGDKLIIKAASILVNTQLENSEIMRTDGNEFLIYLVGYSEKQIDTYCKKLTKEFKSLPHGFGAAVGYSIIADDIKTIDDAINEASLDMKTKKEELR